MNLYYVYFLLFCLLCQQNYNNRRAHIFCNPLFTVFFYLYIFSDLKKRQIRLNDVRYDTNAGFYSRYCCCFYGCRFRWSWTTFVGIIFHCTNVLAGSWQYSFCLYIYWLSIRWYSLIHWFDIFFGLCYTQRTEICTTHSSNFFA